MIIKILTFTALIIIPCKGKSPEDIEKIRNQSDLEFSINYSRYPVCVDVNITEPIKSSNGEIDFHKIVYFDQNNLVKFFDKIKRKEIVFVEIFLYSGSAGEEKKYLEGWVKFLTDRGYKRIVIVGNGTFGTSVLRDVSIP
jgi:hypothetical protein